MKNIVMALLWMAWPAWSVVLYPSIDEQNVVVYESVDTDLYSSPRLNTSQETSYQVAQLVVSKKKVVMYATSWCPYCAKARKYFRAHHIPYTEYDIEKDTAAKRRHQELGGGGVPLILVDKERIRGFSEDSFREVYDRENN
jgi:glutaredoxin